MRRTRLRVYILQGENSRLGESLYKIGRVPDLSPDLAGRLFPDLGGIVRELSGVARIVSGPADQVHLLLSMSPALSVAVMLRVLKTNSSRCCENTGWRTWLPLANIR